MNHTIDNLFGDLSFVAWDNFMEEVPSEEAALSVSEDLRGRLKEMHILDRLDWINEDDNWDKTTMEMRGNLLRECVQELKDNLPTNYEEAWNHPDEKFRKRWREAIKKELDSLINIRKVWNKIKKREMPKGHRCVKSKWVFDIKRNGLFKVRLVACGYSQIPGVDFTESYAPVINDVSWRILLIIKMLMRYEAMIVDVETAFLFGDFEEDVYMTCKEVHDDDEVLLLIR